MSLNRSQRSHNSLATSVSSLCSLAFDLLRSREPAANTEYKPAASEDYDRTCRDRASSCEQLFLQPFNAGSRTHLTPEPYNPYGEACGSRKERDQFRKSRIAKAFNGSRARSHSPNFLLRSESPRPELLSRPDAQG